MPVKAASRRHCLWSAAPGAQPFAGSLSRPWRVPLRSEFSFPISTGSGPGCFHHSCVPAGCLPASLGLRGLITEVGCVLPHGVSKHERGLQAEKDANFLARHRQGSECVKGQVTVVGGDPAGRGKPWLLGVGWPAREGRSGGTHAPPGSPPSLPAAEGPPVAPSAGSRGPGPFWSPTARLLAQSRLTSDLRAQLPGFPKSIEPWRMRAGDGEEGGVSPR